MKHGAFVILIEISNLERIQKIYNIRNMGSSIIVCVLN